MEIAVLAEVKRAYKSKECWMTVIGSPTPPVFATIRTGTGRFVREIIMAISQKPLSLGPTNFATTFHHVVYLKSSYFACLFTNENVIPTLLELLIFFSRRISITLISYKNDIFKMLKRFVPRSSCNVW